MRRLILSLLGMCFVVAGFAQQTVSGNVRDDAGEPVIGAAVQVTGTSTGTITDIDGNYELVVPEGSTTLEVSFLGYEAQSVVLTGASTYDITLSEGIALNEVVFTGYSSGTKRDATGAIATIDAEKLQAIPSANVEQQLQGRASGVTVITNGQPGTTSKVRIRGFGSFNANSPLYVVDGIQTQNVDFLSPDDIATTSILKDAASAAIYGSRGANGVIVYTTKKGARNQGLKVSYDGLYGTTTPGTGQPILTPQEQADYTLRAFQNQRFNNGQDPDTTYSHPQYGQNVRQFTVPDYLLVGSRRGVAASEVNIETERALYNDNYASGDIYLVIPSARGAGTDWYDAVTDPAPIMRHNLGFQGGTDKGHFYISFSTQNQDGILRNQKFQRYSVRTNSEFELIPRVRIGENVQFNYGSTLGLIGGGGGAGVANEESDILAAFRLAPAIPVYNSFGGYAGTVTGGFNNPRNVVAQRDARTNDKSRGFGGTGNVYIDIDIIKGLFFRSLVGGRYNSYAGRFFGRRTYEDSENTASVGYGEFSGESYAWQFTNTLNWDFSLGSAGTLRGLVGYESLNTGQGYQTSSGGINPFSANPNFVNLAQVSNPNVRSSFFPGVTFASILGQVQYNYNEKYYITGVVRQDKSSVFDAATRTGVFPSVSAAWRVTGEDFFQPNDVVSDLKIRGGYGQIGNADAVSPNNRFNLYGGSIGETAYDINGTGTAAQVGFSRSNIGNAGAKWETSTTANIGAEITMFNNKVDFIIDLWQKRNTDILITQQLPNHVAGGSAAPFANVGTIDNKGIDLELTLRDNKNDFSYEATFTGSFLKNRVITLAENIDFFSSGTSRIGAPVRNIAGEPMSTFFGYQVEGLFRDAADVAGSPTQAGAAPGRFKYADIDSRDENGDLTGTPDGIVDEADRTVIGNPIPTFTGGVNLKVAYKGFDVETFLYTSLGNEIFNFSKWFTDFYPSFPGAAISTRAKESWTPQNLDADTPIFENVSNFSTNTQINSFYVEDGSYLRMRHITLGYSLPTNSFNGVFTRARFYLSANNIFTISGYKGLDPQVGGSADTDFGVDIGNYPVTQSFNFGIGLGF